MRKTEAGSLDCHRILAATEKANEWCRWIGRSILYHPASCGRQMIFVSMQMVYC